MEDVTARSLPDFVSIFKLFKAYLTLCLIDIILDISELLQFELLLEDLHLGLNQLLLLLLSFLFVQHFDLEAALLQIPEVKYQCHYEDDHAND